MSVDELLTFLKDNKEWLIQKIRLGKYKLNPVRRVEIPKEETGKVRKLGIPTVVDRVIQQAVTQVLTPIFEKQFSENSYGFRPNRGAHDALKQCQRNVNDGYVYVVDMDLEKFFDKVSHSKLIELLSRTIKDGRVIFLIYKYLNAEFDQHFSTIQESLYQENYDELKEYLNSITGHIESSDDIIITNHNIISSLLQSKKSICDKLNITLDLDINFSKIYRLSHLDIIILLGNILDNAIEANEKVEEDKRYINLIIKQIKTYLKISCENPFSEVPIEKKGVLLTTKPEKQFHGIGLSNVKDTCIKYNGEFKYTFDNKTFYIELKLPNYSSA